MLFISENDTKAKQINKLLEDGSVCFSTKGHVKNISKLTPESTIEYEIFDFETTSNLKQMFNQYPVENVFVATDYTPEGEIIYKHICDICGMQLKRINLYELSSECINECIHSEPRNCVDQSLIAEYENHKIYDLMTGSKLTSLLFRHVCNHYEKSLLINQRQLDILDDVYNANNCNNIRVKMNAYCKGICFESYNQYDLQDIINKEFQCKQINNAQVEYPKPKFDSSLYNRGYITSNHEKAALDEKFISEARSYISQHYRSFVLKSLKDIKLSGIRPISLYKETSELTSPEKNIYRAIFNRTISELICNSEAIETIYRIECTENPNIYFTTKLRSYSCNHIKLFWKDNQSECKMPTSSALFKIDKIENTLVMPAVLTECPEKELSQLLYRNYIKYNKGIKKDFSMTLRDYKDGNVIETTKMLLLNPCIILDNLGIVLYWFLNNQQYTDFCMPIDNNWCLIVGKYGLVLRRVDDVSIFLKLPKDFEVESFLFNSNYTYTVKEAATSQPSQKYLGYFKGTPVQLRKGKYGLYAIVGDKNVSLRSFGNRPIENITWSEVLNHLIKVSH